MKTFVEHEIELSNEPENHRFRVYSLKTGTFYPETEEFFLSSSGDCLMTADGRRLSRKENVIQRYAGVCDMCGRPIFQGDILRTDEMGWKGAVVFDDGRFCLEDDHGGFSALPNWSRCEIIGDIFSTPFRGERSLTEDEERGMAFWFACWNGKVETVAELLPACRDWLNRNLEFTECGERKILCLPLIAALNGHRVRCIELLLANGALPHKRCRETGMTPWAFAKKTEAKRLPILEMLADAAKLRSAKKKEIRDSREKKRTDK